MRIIANNPEKEWERFGKENPYYGVISHDDYAGGSLSQASLDKFFETGEKYIRLIFDQIQAHVDREFKPGSALDFGCGVGRLAIPLAGHCASVTGVDVSPSMLKEAEKNCRERGVANCDFSNGLGDLGQKRFDFINTFIVMQHIPVKTGTSIIRSLLKHLSPGGCGAIHVTYHGDISRKSAMVLALRKKFQVANILFNLLKGIPLRTPMMQMNDYDMNAILWEIQKSGCREFFSFFTSHGGHAGQVVLFKKPSAPLALLA